MCGIAGIVSADAARLQPNVAAMQQAIAHRGPDESGCLVLSGAVLGHQRLAIVDLKSGQQPMVSHDGRLAITFNGEIYGYTEIRKSISAYPLRTTSDTELLLAFYENYREEMMTRLPGMFAFAIWDEHEQTLFCARDRFGEKPFYFGYGPNHEFIFASDLKGLLASGLVRPEIDPQVMSACLQRLYVPPDKTIYKNIYTLPPAHSLTFKNGKTTIKRYWKLPVVRERISVAEAGEKFEALLRQAVRKQLVADVPVGAFLSGGLDSGTIVALASGAASGPIKTFSFGFASERNELGDAKKIAQQYHTQHQEFLDEDFDIADLFLKMASVFDEPFADSSCIPTYLISKHASQQIKVVLTGDGGDEMLGGYAWYRELLTTSIEYRKDILLKKIILKGPLGRLTNAIRKDYAAKAGLLNEFEKGNFLISIHRNQNKYFQASELEELGLPSPYQFPVDTVGTNSLDDVFRMDINDYMCGDILVKIDRASMAHGLELRSPFLDKDLAEFCISLPWTMKLDGQNSKILLRKVARNWLPATHFELPKKGFGAPVKKWLEGARMKELKNDILQSPHSRIFEWIDFNKSKKYTMGSDYQTWSMMALATWLEQHTP